MLTVLEETALFIRREFVESEHLHNLEGLAAIVCPSHDLLDASLQAARLRLEEERAWRPTRRPRREQVVSLGDLLASLS